MQVSVRVQCDQRAQVSEAHDQDGGDFVDHHGGGDKGQTAVGGGEVPHAAQ